MTNITLQTSYDVADKSLISWLNIHYYHNGWYKFYNFLKSLLIMSKSLIFAGLDIDRILHFVFYGKIIYQQMGVGVLHKIELPHRHFPGPSTITIAELIYSIPQALIFRLIENSILQSQKHVDTT